MTYKNQIIKLRKEGKTYPEIEEIVGCTRGVISYHCTQMGLSSDVPSNNKISDDVITQMQTFRQDHTVNETAEKFNVSVSSVCKYTKRSKITRKSENVSKNDIQLNKNGFNTNRLGDLVELNCAMKLIEVGYDVFSPFNSDSSVDMIGMLNNEIYRIQCKHARYYENYISFNVYTTLYNGTRQTYEGLIDYFVIWCSELNSVYIVPYNDVKNNINEVRLNLNNNDTTLKNRSNIRFTKDYII